jgi:hypothetical protein
LHRFANGVLAFLFMLFADFLLQLAGNLVAMHFGYRFANSVAAFLFALNWNALANGILAIFVVGFANRLANRGSNFLHASLLDWLAYGIFAIFVSGFNHFFLNLFFNIFEDCFIALLIASAGFVFVASLRDLLHGCFLYCGVGSQPALAKDIVHNKAEIFSHLPGGRRKTTLGIAARRARSIVLTSTAV